MTAVRRWAVAAATPSAAAIVVLPTPPDPRTTRTERGLSNSFTVAARPLSAADVTRQNSRTGMRKMAVKENRQHLHEAVDCVRGVIGRRCGAADTILRAAPMWGRSAGEVARWYCWRL